MISSWQMEKEVNTTPHHPHSPKGPGQTTCDFWQRKGWEGRHAVSSASRGSREENVRGAKLTKKRTRGVPCSFKCKQGLQGIKCQGRSIDGEKDNKSLNCQTFFTFGLKIRNVVFLNSIIMMLVFFFFFYVSPVFYYTSAVPSLKL